MFCITSFVIVLQPLDNTHSFTLRCILMQSLTCNNNLPNNQEASITVKCK